MKEYIFGVSSKAELKTVHPNLQQLCFKALELSRVDFRILKGISSAADQNKAFRLGFSQIDGYKKVGRHQVGCAIDFMVLDPKTGKFTFGKSVLYARVREAFYAASKILKIPIRT